MTAVTQLPGIDQVGPTIVEALNAVMRQVRGVSKKGRNTQQNYDFRGIDAVLNAAGPAFRDHGIVPSPILEHVEYRDVKTTTGKAAREVTVRVRYRFTGPRGDYVDAVVPGESLDSGDKGTAKAMSVAYRIALIQVLALPTTERDPDAQSYERGSGRVDVAVDAAHREDDEPTRDELLDQVNEVWLALKKERGESEYAALDRMARFCQKWCRVDVITEVSKDGAVEGVDLERLDDKKLTLVRNAMRNSLKELLATGQEA